ncbi:MAG: TlpA family protein disulfide reductase [Deltaproteobacteria bacterium]|nr:TlpA family protein disulfide reductase [Deltaproteobacteria bacterium]
MSAAFFALLAVWACGQDDRPGALHVGDQAPDFSVTDMKGGQVTLRQWAGFPVILRFWSTDCQYCRADTPVFNRYFNDYREKGLKVVYLNNGASSAEVESFVQELDIPFPVVLDDGGKVAALYRVKAVPQTIVIDPRQRIIAAILGGVGQAELEELIGTYLDKGGRQ